MSAPTADPRRDKFAGLAMQAIASWYYDNELNLKPVDVAAVSVAIADALIKELDK
jgi:hypothetical protein